MSSKKPQNTPAAAGNRREQLQRQREQQAKERKIRNLITFSILGVAVLAIVGVIVAVVVSSTKAPEVTGGGAVTGDYAVTAGDPNAPVTLTIYQDFMCPYCGMFERGNRADLEALVDSGTAKIEFHIVNWQDRQSQGTRYSTRTGNAFVAVAKAEPQNVMAFNAALPHKQPEEGTPGLSDAEIAQLARDAGVGNDVIATFARMANEDFITNSTLAAQTSGITGTPSILINGEKWPADNTVNYLEPGPLKAAVEAAAAAK